MLTIQRLYAPFFLGWLLITVLVSNTAYSNGLGISTIPEGTQAILLIDENLKIRPYSYDRETRVLKEIGPCELCTDSNIDCIKKKDQKHEKSGLPYCQSLIGTTTNEIGDSLQIYINNSNPRYMTLIIGGYPRQVCICGCPGKPICR